jgi:ATP-dependent Lon protease
MPDAVAHVENALTLARRLATKHFQLTPILLSGPPGVGKTAFAAGIAEAAGVPAHNFQAAGSSDAYHFQGAPPTFRGSAPSFILRQLLSERIANPVVIVDELDKAASENEQHGRIVDALLAMLEPRTAAAWPDPFLFTPADISAVTWIIVVNEADRLPEALRSRLKHIPIRPPTSDHADHLIQAALLELVKGDVHALEKLPAIEPLARKELADDLQRHGDIRRLKRAVLAAVSAGEWPSVH